MSTYILKELPDSYSIGVAPDTYLLKELRDSYLFTEGSSMKELNKGAIKSIPIQVTKRGGGVLTVASANFQVFDEDDSSVQDSGVATISGNGTSLVTLDGIVDTSAVGFVEGGTYKAKFTVVIGSEAFVEIAEREVKENVIA